MGWNLTSEDLMIGNWIMIHHPSHKPEAVQVTADILKLLERQENGLVKEDSPLYRIIHPIPITKPFLEKNGFKVTEKGCTSWRLDVGRTMIEIYGVTDYHLSINIPVTTSAHGFRWMLYDLTVYNIHELQQALKAFKIRLNITL